MDRMHDYLKSILGQMEDRILKQNEALKAEVVTETRQLVEAHITEMKRDLTLHQAFHDLNDLINSMADSNEEATKRHSSLLKQITGVYNTVSDAVSNPYAGHEMPIMDDPRMLDELERKVAGLEAELKNSKALCKSASDGIEEMRSMYATAQKQLTDLQKDKGIPGKSQIDNLNRQWEVKLVQSEDKHQKIEDELRKEVQRSNARNRAMFEKLQDMRGNIRVMCRIRPALKSEPREELVDFGEHLPGEYSGAWGRIHMDLPRTTATGRQTTDPKDFRFERVFGPDDTNNDVFEEIRDLTQCALYGQKVCIFAYGQTGSGKTYTTGFKHPSDPSQDGIIPRTLTMIFEKMEPGCQLSMSVVEIYMEDVYDLMSSSPGKPKAAIRNMEQAVCHLFEKLDEAEYLISEAVRQRETNSTTANSVSSRSHLVIQVQIQRPDNTIGLLNLIDLAGSERTAKDGNEGDRFQEGVAINQSLSNLNQVIKSLGSDSHVPYNTALTRALKPSLSKGCKTLMFVMVSPLEKDLTVTLQTLEKGQEATRARLTSMRKVPGASSAATPLSQASSSSSRPNLTPLSTPGSTRVPVRPGSPGYGHNSPPSPTKVGTLLDSRKRGPTYLRR